MAKLIFKTFFLFLTIVSYSQPSLQSAKFDAEFDKLILVYDVPIKDGLMNTSGFIELSVDEGTVEYQALTTPFSEVSSVVNDNIIELQLTSPDATYIEGWSTVGANLEVSTGASVFFDQASTGNPVVSYSNSIPVRFLTMEPQVEYAEYDAEIDKLKIRFTRDLKDASLDTYSSIGFSVDEGSVNSRTLFTPLNEISSGENDNELIINVSSSDAAVIEGWPNLNTNLELSICTSMVSSLSSSTGNILLTYANNCSIKYIPRNPSITRASYDALTNILHLEFNRDISDANVNTYEVVTLSKDEGSTSVTLMTPLLVMPGDIDDNKIDIKVGTSDATVIEGWSNLENLEIQIGGSFIQSTSGFYNLPQTFANNISVEYIKENPVITYSEYDAENDQVILHFNRNLDDATLNVNASAGLSVDNALSNYIHFNKPISEVSSIENDNILILQLSTTKASIVESWPDLTDKLELEITTNMIQSKSGYYNHMFSYLDNVKTVYNSANPKLKSARYDADINLLRLEFDRPLNDAKFKSSASMAMSVDDGGDSFQFFSTPLNEISSIKNDNIIELRLSDSDATNIEAWSGLESKLEIDISSALVESHSGFPNEYVSYSDDFLVKYIPPAPAIKSATYFAEFNKLRLEFNRNLNDDNFNPYGAIYLSSDKGALYYEWIDTPFTDVSKIKNDNIIEIVVKDSEAINIESWPTLPSPYPTLTSFAIHYELEIVGNLVQSRSGHINKNIYYSDNVNVKQVLSFPGINNVSYDAESNMLTINFDHDLKDDTFNRYSKIGLSVDNKNTDYIMLTEPISEVSSVKNDSTISIQLTESNANTVESWPNSSSNLELELIDEMIKGNNGVFNKFYIYEQNLKVKYNPVYPIVTFAEYDSKSKQLSLTFNRDLDDNMFNNTASIGLSIDNGKTDFIQLNTPLNVVSSEENDNGIVLKVNDSQASELESWSNLKNNLELKITSNMVKSQTGNFNQYINYNEDVKVNYNSNTPKFLEASYDSDGNHLRLVFDRKLNDALLKSTASINLSTDNRAHDFLKINTPIVDVSGTDNDSIVVINVANTQADIIENWINREIFLEVEINSDFVASLSGHYNEYFYFTDNKHVKYISQEPVVTTASYQSSSNLLRLEFNRQLNDAMFNNTGIIGLSVDGGSSDHLNLTTPLTDISQSNDNIVEFVIAEAQASNLESWSNLNSDLKLKLESSIVKSQSGFKNLALNYTDNLQVNFCNIENTNISDTICEGDVYTLGTQSLTSTGIYTETFKVGECDSTVTLNLLVHPHTTFTDVQSACDSYKWIDGNTYTESNNSATHTIPNKAGCDSIITLDLTIKKSTAFTDVQSACDSYTWIDGNTYTESNNVATHIIPNKAGCDSIITLDLTIKKSTTFTDIQSACNSYEWIDGNTYTESNNSATHTIPNKAGCDSTITLDLTIKKSTSFTDVQTACDSFEWIDGNTYTESNNTAIHTIPNKAGCDSIITLDLTIKNSTEFTDVQSACDSYIWIDGNTYTESNNTATHTITNKAGCDSIITLDLTIKKSTTFTDVHSACDSYEWIDGNTYTESNNTATHTILNEAGCDSIITLDLTIKKSTTFTDIQSACDSYTWIDGNTYTESNSVATHTIPNKAGCDSIITLDLIIKKSTTFTDVQSACDSYTWIDGNTYTESNNVATHIIPNKAGCDSIITLDLTIKKSTTFTDVQTACDSYEWIDGNTYTESNNTATHTIINKAGCDSIITLDLTIKKSTTFTDVQTACDSFDWIDGNAYTESNNTATHTITNKAGCDSIITLDLTIKKSTTFTDVQSVCDSFDWIDGNTYTESNNTATHTIPNKMGCDSVITLDLTIKKSTTFTDIQSACDSYTWIDGNTYTESNSVATHTIPNKAGCDSIITLDLTIKKSTAFTDVQSACDSYTWIDGSTYTESNNVATHTIPNKAGCDSIITLDLTIKKSTTFTDVQTACDSYEWIDGNTYTESNNVATHTITNKAGCDSIITLDLTIKKSTTFTDVQTACESFDWIDGNTYTESNNTATHTISNKAGCDSIITLDLTIKKSTTFTDVQTACDSYEWIDGNTYTESNNVATHTIPNKMGCDSVITLDLTIKKSTSFTDFQTACDSYEWIDGNTYTESNNSATHTILNKAGCDSIINLDLTIKKSTIFTDVQSACDSYTWIDGNTYTESNNVATHIIPNKAGCDSIITLDLTIKKSTTFTDVHTACDSYEWIDGNTYTESNNTATHTIPNKAGCDSIITLDLTIKKSTSFTDVHIAKDSFEWIDGNTYFNSNNSATYTTTNKMGCDSVITLDLTIQKTVKGVDNQTACGSFTWIDGITYTENNNRATYMLKTAEGIDSLVILNLTINKRSESIDSHVACKSFTWSNGETYYEDNNTATQILTNSVGCDSLVTLNLTILKVNTNIIIDDLNLKAEAEGATYQWLDCDNNHSVIVGETKQDFVATNSGNYAVEVTENNCADTSMCVSVTITDVTDELFENVNIYPNPNRGEVNIDLGNIKNVDIRVYSSQGKTISRFNNVSSEKFKLNINESTGVYFIELISEGKKQIYKVVKE